MSDKSLYICLVSVHGLIRGEDLELGRDSDTGGQIKYVVELAKTLARDPRVRRVDILTRRVLDSRVDRAYSRDIERIAPGANIIRLISGPRRYLRKETLWPYLDSFVDNAIHFFRKQDQVPDIIHSHYADAGYVGSRLAGLLELPLIHTGHSLGRDKLRRLLDQGVKQESIEKQYHITRRIEAEEMTMDTASKVIASTEQEIREQYSVYDNYHPKRMMVIPPGVELSRFYPPDSSTTESPVIETEINCFLKDPSKPMILAISRPDPRKNISALVNAYGKSQELQKAANLVIIAGSRDVISEAEKSSRDVLTDLLLLIDKYDLYGRVAYPKSHEPQEIPMLFRLAMKSRGVFINPALTEPFGLTLIEAAASGLPVVATEDGGPKEIIRHCKNGILIDPLNEKKMASALQKILSNKEKWNKYSESGIQGANNHFSWEAHTERYITVIDQLKNKYKKRIRITSTSKTPLISADRMIICDIDNTLLGDKKSLKELIDSIQASNKDISFGVATGRRVESALAVLKEWKVPVPDVIISSVGSEIHYSEGLFQDMAWAKHIDHRWKPDSVKEILESVPGLKLQPSIDQRKHKISYFMDPVKTPDITEIMSLLRQNRLHVNLIFSHDEFLDILPIRASKGLAVRYFAIKWGIPFERILVAGDSGNDEEMLRGNTLAVVVGNYSHELESLREDPHIFFAENKYAGGILEGIRHYDFLGRIHAPV